MATSKVKDLDSNGLGWAATVIHKEIMGLDYKAISDYWRALSEDPQVAQPVGFFGNSPPLTFTESMKFDAYGPQFGLNKVVALRVGHSAWMDGRIIMDPGREGGGSVSLQIGLSFDAMTALESDDEFKIYVLEERKSSHFRLSVEGLSVVVINERLS
ncbi:uncharacterized protein LOC141653915 [Silene latifolia]|uniref:uncharacterized protein LOC141653915 n=1 Tax=Silene latifolia TaxID=37657 RepID=UPI003D784B2C